MIRLKQEQDWEKDQGADFYYQQLLTSKNAEEAKKEQDSAKILNKLDSLRFSTWHFFVALALGFIWIFDGYEVTLISLYRHQIELETSKQVFKTLVSAYQVGGMVGSLVFGVLAFIIGRKQIFMITLLLYFFGVMFSGIKTNITLFIIARFVTGLSVGGQFTAIFTAIDEFMPPSYRGRVNIGIDGTWHLGSTLASILTLFVDEHKWRSMFLIGCFGIFALAIMRRNVPQSPRWLLLKGKNCQAIQTIGVIVEAVRLDRCALSDVNYEINQIPSPQINKTYGGYMLQIANLLRQGVTKHTSKFIVSFTLIFTQALFFNLVYYQYPEILSSMFKLKQRDTSLYMLPLSFISFISTLFIGPYFDLIGRKKLVLLTYILSAILVMVNYSMGNLIWREIFMCLLFVFASPAASSANLIASQIFPTSSRTIMLFVMFIVSMLGGTVGVLFVNHVTASIMMIAAGLIAFIFCPESSNKTLQQIQKL